MSDQIVPESLGGRLLPAPERSARQHFLMCSVLLFSDKFYPQLDLASFDCLACLRGRAIQLMVLEYGGFRILDDTSPGCFSMRHLLWVHPAAASSVGR